MTNERGLPVEYKILPRSIADITALNGFNFDLPKDSIIYADRAYNDYFLEDVLSDVDIYPSPMRRKNSKRSKNKSQEFIDHIKRKLIETVGSSINRLMPKSIHSVTSRCFELKILLFLMGYTFLNIKFCYFSGSIISISCALINRKYTGFTIFRLPSALNSFGFQRPFFFTHIFYLHKRIFKIFYKKTTPNMRSFHARDCFIYPPLSI